MSAWTQPVWFREEPSVIPHCSHCGKSVAREPGRGRPLICDVCLVLELAREPERKVNTESISPAQLLLQYLLALEMLGPRHVETSLPRSVLSRGTPLSAECAQA
jgi:hypothetical protein